MRFAILPSSIIVVLGLAAMLQPLKSQAGFILVDLGISGEAFSEATAINESRQVVIQSAPSMTFAAIRTYVYEQGTRTPIGTLEGGGTYGFGMNDLGDVVGYSLVGTLDRYYHAFRYTGGVMTDLGTLGGEISAAYSINNSRQITGWSFSPMGTRAYRYENRVMTSLGTLPPENPAGGMNSSWGAAINRFGDVTGYSYTPVGGRFEQHAFKYSEGRMTDLGTFGGDSSEGHGINDRGDVVGESSRPRSTHSTAFLYSGGVMHDLGTLGGTYSQAQKINNHGWIVGLAGISGNTSHAFLWRDGVMTDLNDLIPENSGWTLTFAEDINDHGDIVGYGFKDGRQRAFLLHAVPEPASRTLLIAAVIGLVVVAGRRKAEHAWCILRPRD